ncbi:MAG: hypothetical protein L6Q78_06760 [Bacteroidia bacterium]|nr:hypothetical protein [Bacteroidia bacterium]
MNRKFYISGILITNASCAFFGGYFGWDIQLGIWMLIATLSAFYLREENWVVKSLLIAPSIIYSISDWVETFHVLPLKLLPLVAIIAIFTLRLKLRFYSILGIAFLLGISSYFMMNPWLSYVNNRNYSEIEGIQFPVPIFSISGDNVSSSILNSDSLYVFNCWSVNCGSCFRKFPDYQGLASSYGTKKISFNQLNFPIKSKAQLRRDSLIQEHFSSLPNYIVNDLSVWDKLHVNGVPLILILEKGKIIFIGNIPIEASNVTKASLRKKLDEILINY